MWKISKYFIKKRWKKVWDRYQDLTEEAETTWVYEKILLNTQKATFGHFKDSKAIKFVSWISLWNVGGI